MGGFFAIIHFFAFNLFGNRGDDPKRSPRGVQFAPGFFAEFFLGDKAGGHAITTFQSARKDFFPAPFLCRKESYDIMPLSAFADGHGEGLTPEHPGFRPEGGESHQSKRNDHDYDPTDACNVCQDRKIAGNERTR